MKYARQCSVSGAGMNKGFCIEDGRFYVCEAVGIEAWLKEHTTYESADEAYEDGYYYYTEWEDEDDFQYEETPVNASAEFLRSMVAWMNRRPETLNDGKTIEQLIIEYKNDKN